MPSSLSKQQLLQKKRDAEKLRQIKIKSNPESLALEKAKRHQKYINRLKKKQVKPVAEMTQREVRNKRKQWRKNTSNSRARTKERNKFVNFLKNNTPEASDEEDDVGILVGVVEDGRKTSGRKRALKNRSALNRKLQRAVKRKEDAIKSAQKFKQRYYRLLHNRNTQPPSGGNTPRTKVRTSLRGRRVDPDIRKKLLFGEVLKEQLAQNYRNAKGFKSKQLFAQAVSGKVIRKYRCMNQSKTFLKSVPIALRSNPMTFSYLRKPNDKKKKVSNDIEIFLSRDEFTRLCPGKKDTVTKNKIKKQKRLFNMTLIDLHKAFLQEHSYKICYATFCKLRPFWMVDPKVVERDTCLCSVHANIKFLTDALHRYGVVEHKKPRDFFKDLCCDGNKEECLLRKCCDCRGNCISYKEYNSEQTGSYKKWVTMKEARIDNHGKNITVQITKKNVVGCTIGDMVDQIEALMPKFMVHTANINHQYQTIDALKKTLSANQVLLHIDFSENFSCKYSAEVQSVHFGASRQQVSLHTGVMYFKDANVPTLRTLSFCTSSDNLRHDPAAIWAHLTPMLKYAKENLPNIQEVHFISDGPTTQYRNKKNFFLFNKCIQSFFPDIVSASWNFSEAGHGKGAMDGVGAAIKQTADRHIAHGHDIASYAELLQLLKERCKGVLLTDVDLRDIQKFESLLSDSLDIKTFKGTMGVHQIAWSGAFPFQLLFRNLSCFTCQTAEECTHGYHMGQIQFNNGKDIVASEDEDDIPDPETRTSANPETRTSENPEPQLLVVTEEPAIVPRLQPGDWVVVEYDGITYPGEVIAILKDGSIEVNTMEPTTNRRAYKWPMRKDQLLYAADKVVKKISPPVPCGSRAAQFTFDM